jgi:hypothetical protein
MYQGISSLPAILFSILLNLFSVAGNFAQISEYNTQIALQNQTEKMYGPDDYLLQGRIYRRQNINANGHPFFNDPEWKEAILFSHGKSFPGQLIQYDIEQEVIILHIINDQGDVLFVCAEDELIDSLIFSNRLFINLKNTNKTETANGYYELVFKGRNLFVLKHEKSFIKNYNSINPNGYYTKQASVLSLSREDGLIPLPDKRSFLLIFESHRQELKKFIRHNHIRYRKSRMNELKILCEYADKLSREER